MTAEPRTRLGPYVHARVNGGWEDRRALIVGWPVHCARCKLRVEAGATVLKSHQARGYLCRSCRSHHVRGQGACYLCDRLRMDGPRCWACLGVGYGARKDDP